MEGGMKPIDVYKQFHIQNIRALQEKLQQDREAASETLARAEEKAKRSAAAKAGLKIPALAERTDRYRRDFVLKSEGVMVIVCVEIDSTMLPEHAALEKARLLRKAVCDLASTSGAAKFATWANMRNGGETPNPKTLPALLREWVEFNACSF
jgi:hypothetical protein